MNCIDKMYKEAEEIRRREALENQNVAPPKEVRFNFLDSNINEEETLEIKDYSKEIDISNEKWVKKYLTIEKIREFVLFIFKKYLCFYDKEWNQSQCDKFFDSAKKRLDESDIPGKLLPTLTAEFLEIEGINDWENSEKFFLIPYNALFEDEKGFFAVVEKNAFSDVPKPQPINGNQVKKIIKETMETYVNELSEIITSEKERNNLINNLKGYINKYSSKDAFKLQIDCENKLYDAIKKKGLDRNEYNEYLNNRGLRIIRQGNIYYREIEYKMYGKFKKIEFRY